jgi:hypothetical protein
VTKNFDRALEMPVIPPSLPVLGMFKVYLFSASFLRFLHGDQRRDLEVMSGLTESDKKCCLK